jgi:hypothetical protein
MANFLKFLLVIVVILPSWVADAKKASTYPMPPRKLNQSPNPLHKNPERIDPAMEVPVNLDDLKFTVKGSYAGTEFYKEKVPLWTFHDNFNDFESGFIPVGTEIKLEYFISRFSRHYYEVKNYRESSGEGATAYLDGRFIKVEKK